MCCGGLGDRTEQASDSFKQGGPRTACDRAEQAGSSFKRIDWTRQGPFHHVAKRSKPVVRSSVSPGCGGCSNRAGRYFVQAISSPSRTSGRFSRRDSFHGAWLFARCGCPQRPRRIPTCVQWPILSASALVAANTQSVATAGSQQSA